jgi:hypothetical protein
VEFHGIDKGYRRIYPYSFVLHMIDLYRPFNDDQRSRLKIVQSLKETIQSVDSDHPTCNRILSHKKN